MTHKLSKSKQKNCLENLWNYDFLRHNHRHYYFLSHFHLVTPVVCLWTQKRSDNKLSCEKYGKKKIKIFVSPASIEHCAFAMRESRYLLRHKLQVIEIVVEKSRFNFVCALAPNSSTSSSTANQFDYKQFSSISFIS